MKMKVSELLQYLNTLSNYILYHQSKLRDNGFETLADFYLELLSSPDPQSCVNKINEQIGHDSERLLKKELIRDMGKFYNTERYFITLFKFLSSHKQHFSQKADWRDHELTLDNKELYDYLKSFEEKNPQPEVLKLKNTYQALCEIIEKEKSFIATCQNINVEKYEKACSDYYIEQQKKSPTRYSAHQVHEWMQTFTLFKQFPTVTNYFLFDFEDAFLYATNTLNFTNKIIQIFASSSFSNFYHQELVALAVAYILIIPHLTKITDDIANKTYNPPAETQELLKVIAWFISTPMQRLMRYSLTFAEVKKNILSSELNFGKSFLKDVVNAVYTRLENRVKEAQIKIDPQTHSNIMAKLFVPCEISFQADEANKLISTLISFINFSAGNGKWKIRGLGTIVKDGINKTILRRPYHIAKMIVILSQSDLTSGEKLSKVIEIAKIAKDYRPSAFNIFYKRDPELQKFYELVANINHDDYLKVCLITSLAEQDLGGAPRAAIQATP